MPPEILLPEEGDDVELEDEEEGEAEERCQATGDVDGENKTKDDTNEKRPSDAENSDETAAEVELQHGMTQTELLDLCFFSALKGIYISLDYLLLSIQTWE